MTTIFFDVQNQKDKGSSASHRDGGHWFVIDGLACFSDVVKAGLKKRLVARFECAR